MPLTSLELCGVSSRFIVMSTKSPKHDFYLNCIIYLYLQSVNCVLKEMLCDVLEEFGVTLTKLRTISVKNKHVFA